MLLKKISVFCKKKNSLAGCFPLVPVRNYRSSLNLSPFQLSLTTAKLSELADLSAPCTLAAKKVTSIAQASQSRSS